MSIIDFFTRFYRRGQARTRGVPFYDGDFYIYTAWWSIEKDPNTYGWPNGVKFTKADMSGMYSANEGDVIPIARIGNLSHEYKKLGTNRIPGDDHLPGGSVSFKLEYWRTTFHDPHPQSR